MNITYFVRAAAAGIAFSALPIDVGTVHADPTPPCTHDCGPGIHDTPSDGRDSPGINIPGSPGVQPPSGGGPNSGGRSVK